MTQTNANLQNLLTLKVAETLRQGVDLLEKADDSTYTKVEKSAYADGGAIGRHFRHCLEFVNCFLTGIENGRVDYNRRERNHLLETNRKYAIAEYGRTIQILENLTLPEDGNALLVKPEDTTDDEDYWCASSIERELDFLQSHTIHHYALIGFKLRAFGFKLSAEFGVAPSTLRFWKGQNSAAG
jgi:hypothetical protein